jgi:hypothetical protein
VNKLKLRIENLKVESFETSVAGGERRGTILGAARPRPLTQGPLGCQLQTEMVTGGCCDITLAVSCIQTNCLAECNSFDPEICLA